MESAMPQWSVRLPRIAGVLALISAGVIAFGVIPMVRSDSFVGGTPRAAVPAFWLNVLFTVIVAAAAFAPRRASATGSARRFLLIVAGVVALLLGLVLVDAATAYPAHGAQMRGAVVQLWVCVGLDCITGIALIVTGLTRPTPEARGA
jgi:hypothetical protein